MIKRMTHDETTRHGTNIIDLLMKYANDNKLSTYELFLVVIEVIILMKMVADENMRKSDS
jgi:hypothetical protein